ncbi:MAG: [FeFe] hydrogenase H-cluster maturation GTPase HydF [Victivallaceae bacterium]|nr:[FeFe] hydrogenase H-cluster maturation GTPase HydF [Victivallaceae bacterium]
METVPKSMRLQIALFGRTNVGKSSFLNLVSGQDVAITSPVPGTTTDVVEKTMELLPLGPVVFLDTAGLDDRSELGALRIHKTKLVFNRADVAVILCEAQKWGAPEEEILGEALARKIPVIAVVNKIDLARPGADFLTDLKGKGISAVIAADCVTSGLREGVVAHFKQALIECCPEDFLSSPPLVGDLLRPGSVAVLIVPIDLQAPKGRLILPQVQTIRDALDNDGSVLVVKEREYAHMLDELKTPPGLVVCDSQVVMKMVADTPQEIPCTTFSILFSRLKGDMQLLARGTAAIGALKDGDRILIAEACSHHAASDDIGRVKIPRWLRQFTGADLQVEVSSGRDYPENLREYALVIHCGGCMLTRREILSRMEIAARAGVPVTNYGMCISYVQGVLERVLTPFPAALEAFREAKQSRLAR